MDDKQEKCIGCGVIPVIEVNDRKLCGNCFLLGISVSLHSGANGLEPPSPSPLESSHLRELRSTLLTAIDEIQRLRDRIDELGRENASLRQGGGAKHRHDLNLPRNPRPED